MRILFNERVYLSDRSHAGIPFQNIHGDCLLNVQAENDTYSGTPIISNSVFYDRGPSYSLVHIYTTFWTYDTAETYFNVIYLIDGLGLNHENFVCGKPYVPDHKDAFLHESADFKSHLLKSNPALYRAVFCGHDLDRQVFGVAFEKRPTALPIFVDGDTDCHNRTLAYVPLSSYLVSPEETLHNKENMSEFLENETLSGWIEHTNRLLNMKIISHLWMKSIEFDSKTLSERNNFKHALTEDRILMGTLDAGCLNPQWYGIDLMTAPLRYACCYWRYDPVLAFS